jgi:uncharacterized protein YbjT (DUF2867 family)
VRWRDDHGAGTARARGASETVLGDLADPDSLKKATEGVDGVFHINPAFAPREAEMGVAMVQAARAAGVRKFVFSGVFHPSVSAMVNHAAKQPVEEALYASGMDYTILQPAMFMQMLAGSWAEARDHGHVTAPYSQHSRMCYVDYRDVAEAAALAMTGDTLSYGTFELCSPGMFDRNQMAALIQAELGRPVRAEASTPEAAAASMPDGPLRDGLTAMMQHYDSYGFPGGNALVLRTILGREPRTVREFLHELATAPAS